MLEIKQNIIFFLFCSVLVLSGSLYAASQVEGLEDLWDPARYIGLDEIKPGMEAYCLTEYGVAGIEKFAMEVVDVVRSINPSSGPGSRDAILVKGIDERFIHTGPVAGCSGSPVYIDGRLAGALAFTWTFSKDPLYGATPIAEMLTIGRAGRSEISETSAGWEGLAFDYTAGIDFAKIERILDSTSVGWAGNLPMRFESHNIVGMGKQGAHPTFLPCTFNTSGLPSEVCEQLRAAVEPFGFVVASGATGADANRSEKTRLIPGAALAVPLVSGDISMSVSGTVTDVVGDKVYGFGHLLLGQGPIDLPMATAKVHTVISNLSTSFKLVSVLDTVGAITNDQGTGIVGKIGAEAKLIPLSIRIDRYNDTQSRLYNCRLVNNRTLTPFYLRMAVAAAALQLGNFPVNHTIEYKATTGMKNIGPVSFSNVSSDTGLNELLMEIYSSVGLVLNNPYQQVDLESINIELRIVPESIISHIWSVDLSDTKVKAGQCIEITAILESILAGKKQYRLSVEIPEDLPPGKYDLVICGYRDYEQFLVKAAGHRFAVQSLPSLIDALNNALSVERDKLYCLLVLPAGGLVIEKSELPDLPATKALLMQDTKRALTVRPYQHWLENNLKTGSIVIDKKEIKITVEK